MGRAWDNSASHRSSVTTLRARVCSSQRLQPFGRSSQRCLLLQQGPGVIDPGLSQWAQPEKMQGNAQRIGTHARRFRWLLKAT